MKKPDYLNSIKVIISPWDKGFSCGILLDNSNKMTTEQYELCTTIARGMIYVAMNNPDKVYRAGVKGLAEDDSYRKKDLKVIDFLDHLKRKRNLN